MMFSCLKSSYILLLLLIFEEFLSKSFTEEVMKKAIVAAFLMLGLSACATSGTMVTEQQTSSFEEGVTTELEIREVLGEPTTITTSTEERTLIYTGIKYRTKAATYVPVVGIFAGGSDAQSTSVIFKIGPDGVLEEMTRSETNIDTTTGVK